MAFRNGSATTSVVLGVASVLAVGAAGYAMLTGNTLCSLVGACGLGSTNTSETVALSVSDTPDSCCPLSKGEAVVANVADTPECSKSKATTVNAADTSECSKAVASECSKSKATTVNAADTSECSKAVASECSKSKATTVNAAAAPECSKSKATDAVAMNVTWTYAAGGAMVVPVFSYECGTVAADCSASVCDKAELVSASTCSKAAAAECSKAKAVNAAADAAECEKAAECDKSAQGEKAASADDAEAPVATPVAGR